MMMTEIGPAVRRLAACATLSLAICTPAAADEQGPWVLTVFEDRAQGEELIAGDHARAMDVLGGKAGKPRTLEANNNLCVAYALAEDLGSAEEACGKALSAGARSFFWSGPSLQRRDRAVAYSNRGVVRAMAGDREGALSDFRRALELQGTLDAAVQNLARLRSADAPLAAATNVR